MAASILAVTWATISAASVTEPRGSSTNLNWISCHCAVYCSASGTRFPESEIAEVTQIPGRLAGPQVAVGPGGRGSCGGRGGCRMPPAAPHRLGGRRGDAARRGAGRRDVRPGRRDVRYGGGAGLTLGRRSGHLGGFLARAPGGAEHVGLGRLVVS